MKKNFRFLFTVLAALALTLCLCTAALAAWNPVKYIDDEGDPVTCTDYQVLNTDNFPDEPGMELGPGWYVVQGNVTYKNRINITAFFDPEEPDDEQYQPVRLILCDGCTLNLNQGIHLESICGLIVYGQSDGTGTLNAEYNDFSEESPHAVIGGDAPRQSGGYLELNGGVVNVTGYTAGASIGGSAFGTLMRLQVNGGRLTAENSYGAPAIGSGLSYSGRATGRVTVTGGEIYADSYFQSLRTADAIGSHYECGGLAELTITGGKVTAFGRYAGGGLPPCAMMTYGTITLGDNVTVSAGGAPQDVAQVAYEKRVDAIRSNVYVIVQASGPSLTASVFSSGRLAAIILGGIGLFVALAAALILLVRRRRIK